MPPMTSQTPPPMPQPDLPQTDMPRRDKKSLAIALIVAFVLLLAAAVVAWWVMNQKNANDNTASNNTSQTDPGDTSDVTGVSWVPPTDLPATYVRSDQNTEQVLTTYYSDTSTSCGIATNVTPLNEQYGMTPKDAIAKAASAAEAAGIKTTSSSEGPPFHFKDAADANREYTFESLVLAQDINVEGVAFKKQNNTVAFKQFGQAVASIGIACKVESWEAQKAVLEEWVKKFTVKTER